jgi:hypothetical protein
MHDDVHFVVPHEARRRFFPRDRRFVAPSINRCQHLS